MTNVRALVYELALHALQQQERDLAELRSRTSTLLAAAGLVASFLGATSMRQADGITVWALLAFATFAANGALGLAVLWPWDVRFEFDARLTYDRIRPWLDDAPQAYTRTAFLLADRHRRNQRSIARLEGIFRAAVVTLGLQTLLWTLALGVAS